MKTQTPIPLYRGLKLLTKDQYVEGVLDIHGLNILQERVGIQYIYDKPQNTYMTFPIDESTLEISFDGGKKWYAIETIRTIIKFCENTSITEFNELAKGKQ